MTENVQYCLRVIVGKSYGAEFLLSPGEERVIGSDAAADIYLDGEGIETRHARIQLEHDELRVVEIARTRSMKVNGTKQKSARLENGDQLVLGEVTLRVQRRLRFEENKRSKSKKSDAAPKAKASGERDSAAKPAQKPPLAPTSEAPVGDARAASAPSTDESREAPAHTTAAASLATRESSVREVEVLDREDDLSQQDAGDVMPAVLEQGLWWPRDELPPLELQHVWFDLARDDGWRSLAIVPTDAVTPTLPVGHAFARMASLNPQAHVLLVDATPREHALRGQRPFGGTIASQVKQFPQANYDFLDASSLGMNDAEVAHLYIPQLLEYIASGTGRYNKVLIATGSLLSHARSIPVARAVDAVLLNVGVGSSRLPDVTRTLEIVGRERVMGSLTVEPVD